jgi:hypothetical protein
MTFPRASRSAIPPRAMKPNDTPQSVAATAAQVNFGYEPTPPHSEVSVRDVAAYIADMLIELRELAQDTGLETLGRVLEIAEREAKWRMEERP